MSLHCLNTSNNLLWFLLLQRDVLRAKKRQKATVTEEDLEKLRKFTEDFGFECDFNVVQPNLKRPSPDLTPRKELKKDNNTTKCGIL